LHENIQYVQYNSYISYNILLLKYSVSEAQRGGGLAAAPSRPTADPHWGTAVAPFVPAGVEDPELRRISHHERMQGKKNYWKYAERLQHETVEDLLFSASVCTSSCRFAPLITVIIRVSSVRTTHRSMIDDHKDERCGRAATANE
jgi:hypothetical protein